MFLVNKVYESFNFSHAVLANISEVGVQQSVTSGILASRGCELVLVNYTTKQMEGTIEMASQILNLAALTLETQQPTSIVIILQNLQVLIGTVQSETSDDVRNLTFLQVHTLELNAASWNHYVDVHVTTNYILFAYSKEKFVIQPYHTQDGALQFPIHLTINRAKNCLQLVPYDFRHIPSHENEFSIASLNKEKECYALKQILANSPEDSGNLIVQIPLETPSIKVFVHDSGIIYQIGTKLQYTSHKTPSVFIPLGDGFLYPIKQILQLTKQTLIFQNGAQRQLFLQNAPESSKLIELGTYSLADSLVRISPSLIFLASSTESCQLLHLSENKVIQVQNLTNLGRIRQIDSCNQEITVTSFGAVQSVHTLSKSIKMDKLLDQDKFSEPRFFAEESSDPSVVKCKTFGALKVNLLESNELVLLIDDKELARRSFSRSITDFELSNGQIHISFWFSANIQRVDSQTLNDIDWLVMDNQGFYLNCHDECYQQTQTVKGLIHFESILLVSFLKDKITGITISKNNQIESSVTMDAASLFVKFVVCEHHILAIYVDFILCFSKQKFFSKRFTINKAHVHDAQLSQENDQMVLSTMSGQVYKKQQFHYSEGVWQCFDILPEDARGINYTLMDQQLIIFVSNQVRQNELSLQADDAGLSGGTKPIHFSRIHICLHRNEYSKADPVSSYPLDGCEVYAAKIYQYGDSRYLYFAGRQHFTGPTKLRSIQYNGFLTIFNVTATGKLIQKYFWNTVHTINDLAVLSHCHLYIVSDGRATLVQYADQTKFLPKLKKLIPFDDFVLSPMHIETKGTDVILYDDLKNVHVFKEGKLHIVHQFQDLNWQVRCIGDYIVRSSYEAEIGVYRQHQVKQVRLLQKIGYGLLRKENVTAMSVNETYLYLGTKTGTVYECRLLSQQQLGLYLEIEQQLTNERLKLKKKPSSMIQETEEVKLTRIVSEDSAKQKAKESTPEYLQKLFAKKIENLSNIFVSLKDLVTILDDPTYPYLSKDLRTQYSLMLESLKQTDN